MFTQVTSFQHFKYFFCKLFESQRTKSYYRKKQTEVTNTLDIFITSVTYYSLDDYYCLYHYFWKKKSRLNFMIIFFLP